MRLTIKNIGKIDEADIELNGITVIAGENNTGKSTVGKTLFCVLNRTAVKMAIIATRTHAIALL